MVIVYESKTGFTKKYAQMLAKKTGLKALPTREFSKVDPGEEIVFLGWIRMGKIQGLGKIRKYNVKVVCGSGAARSPEPSLETFIARNKLQGIPFFYLRGGCVPLKARKGMERIFLSLFVGILKMQKNKDDKTKELITHVVNGFNGVREENLKPVLKWLKSH